MFVYILGDRHNNDTGFVSVDQINKPLVERRRRERMKFCLDELKTLVLRAKRKNVSI